MMLSVRPLREDEPVWVRRTIAARWGSDAVVGHGVAYEPARLPGLVAEEVGVPVGLLTVMTSMFVPLVGLAPGIPGGRPGQGFAPDPIYLPTWVEWGILLGIASFVGMAITLGVRRFVAPDARWAGEVPGSGPRAG